MVQCIERFQAELELCPFGYRYVLEYRKICRQQVWATNRVTSFVAELPRVRRWSQLLKRAAAHPLVRCVRSVIRIRQNIGTAREEARDFRRAPLHRSIIAVIHSKRSARSKRDDGVQLPAVDEEPRCRRRCMPARQCVSTTEYESMRCIK